ncbi:ABC transporter permease, partial [Candidatus Desantisbacteria bacterium]|nr:ABC transporter permease [Candidatus Desantisbacteria bacterium]
MNNADLEKEYDILISPNQGAKHYWRNIWCYRELFVFLAWRDILVRYKQTVIGIAWSVIRPLLTMIVFTIIFGRLAKFPAGGVPYPIMVFAAMLPWQFFANSLSESSNSLISNTNLISKVYFPRLIIPVSTIIVSLVDFFISFLILILLMVWYQFIPDWKMLTIPFFLCMVFFIAFGVGFWFSALNVKYRDFKHIVPFIIQFGLYISPVGFNSNIIPEKWRLVYSLNPMVGVIDGFRWAILGKNSNIYWT